MQKPVIQALAYRFEPPRRIPAHHIDRHKNTLAFRPGIFLVHEIESFEQLSLLVILVNHPDSGIGAGRNLETLYNIRIILLGTLAGLSRFHDRAIFLHGFTGG